MKKKWILIPSLLLLTGLGVLFATPMGQPLREELGPKVVVDKAMRTEAIDTLAATLNAHYVFPDKARQMETMLRQSQHDGKYDRITDGDQLARQLTEDLRGVAQDLHMRVGFSRSAVPPDRVMGPRPTTKAEWQAQAPLPVRLWMGIYQHVADFGVEKVEHLDPKVGYLKVSGFPPPFFAADKYAAAMDQLADTDGLIIDVRENGGGGPDTVALLASYFVDQRTRLNDIWDRNTGSSTQHWTQDQLAGKRYGGTKPVLILAGPHTRSAGEDFTYTMQAMKRATVIGAPSWGGAHPSRPYRLGEHFFAVVPDARSISPITNSNWEGTGVLPDVAAKPDQALDVAREWMARRLNDKAKLATAAR